MFHLNSITVPSGHTATMLGGSNTDVAVRAPGDRLGPQGSAYFIAVSGLGTMYLEDVGGVSGGWGVRVNGASMIWSYGGEGEGAITVDASGNVMLSGGNGPLFTRLNPTWFGQASWSGFSQEAPAITLDQAQAAFDGNGGAADNWQSFTAGKNGFMTRLDVMASSGVGSRSQAGSIRFYQGEGVGGRLLSDQAFTFQPVYTTYQQCNIAAPFAVVEGQKYTYRITIPTETVGWVYTAPASAYPRGRCNLPNTAMVFRTYVIA